MITENVPSTKTEAGKLVESRVRDAEQGHAIFKKLETDDRDAAWKRSNIDYMIDGGLPYDELALADAGRGEDANVNFMEGKAEDDAAQTPFIEMTTVAPVLWNCRTSHGNSNEQATYGKIISEEHTRTVREWGEDFDYFRLKLAQQFTRHGVGFLYWEDEIDWRFRTDGLDAFKVPRNTESRSNAIPYAICKREMSVDTLYNFIRNEAAAREIGKWNIDAVKAALCDSFFGDRADFTDAWPEFVKEMRENDLTVGATKKQIKVYHLWVRELDKRGSVSHYIGLQSGAVKDRVAMLGNGFLYEHKSRFNAFKHCMIPFFYGIGTHATIHTARGQGEMNFGPITIANRARCTMLDGVKAASSIILQADSPNDAEGAAYIQRGPFLIFSGNTKVQANALPDVSSRMLPVLRDMQTLRQNLTGSFQSRAITEQGSQERTAYEVKAAQNQGGALESARLTLFFGPWSRAGKEIYDRMMSDRLRDDDPGGAEAFDFRKRCMARGVPPEALKAVYSVEAVRTVGYGSPQARQAAAEEIYQKSGGFDEVGRKEALRDCIASIPGVDYATADRYVGPIDAPRLTVDDQIAELENNDFRAGQQVPVTDGQNHWVHCQHHSALVTETVDAFEQGQMDTAQLVPILAAALDNMQQHSQLLDLDPIRQKEAGYVRKFIQENNGTLEQQENKLIAEQRRQQEDAQAAAQDGGGQPMDAEEERKWQAHEQDIAIREREYLMRQKEMDQKLALQSQEAALRRSQADLKLSTEIAAKRQNMQGAEA